MKYKDEFIKYIVVNGSGTKINSAEGNGVIKAVQNNFSTREERERTGVKVQEDNKKIEIFLSYCWKDDEVADQIENCLSSNQDVMLHRDKVDIGKWKSIKEYMQSILHMDYIIFLISDSYLKSENCMYEVLEVMRDRTYKDRIFPAVIHTGIYDSVIQASYVIYWQEKYKQLKDVLEGVEDQNMGKLGEDLKRRQNISSNIAEFLDCISNMNNPNVGNVCEAIEQKLREEKIISQIL